MKKIKEEFNLMAVLDKLSTLMVEEQLVNRQKALLYLKYKTYLDLYSKEKEEDSFLPPPSSPSPQKENLLNLNVDLNQLEFKEDSSLPFKDKLANLKQIVKEKDRKIIELENKVIKLQTIRRYENTTHKQGQVDLPKEKEEILNLKTKLEYSRVEGERDRRELNSKLREYMLKYEEVRGKYSQCYTQLGVSLTNLEDLRKFHMSRDIKKTKKISLLNSQIKGFEFLLKDLEGEINGIQLAYSDLLNGFIFMENKNKEMHERINKYKILKGGRGDSKDKDRSDKSNVHSPSTPHPTSTTHTTSTTTGDDFYEKEIHNLLEVCDSLTEDNKRLHDSIDSLHSQIDILKRKTLSLEREKELFKAREASSLDNIHKYLQDINQLTDTVQENCRRLELSNSERNKLTKLNVERITLIEKYKEDLRNKTIENTLLENKYKETVEQLEEYNRRFEERLRSRVPPSEGIFIPCNLCDTNSKNVALLSCMHTFCDKCIETRIKFRNRRCPTCGTPFGSNDVKKIYI